MHTGSYHCTHTPCFATRHCDKHVCAGGTSLHSRDVDAELDEYSDNDDPGYRRQDIRGQEAFIAQELDLSDDEASHRGPTDFHSPSKTLHELDSSSARDSSYMAEPAGTSAYGSEAVSEMFNGTQQPRMSGPLLPQQLSITLKPGMADASLPDQDTGHLLALDTQRSDQSADSSVSLTVTDKSRADPDEHVSSSQGGEAVSAAAPTGTSLVHQQSGFRHILDGMLEKVSDAFARHSPRGGEQAHEGSECSDASSSDAGDMPPDEQAGGMPTLRTHRRWHSMFHCPMYCASKTGLLSPNQTACLMATAHTALPCLCFVIHLS